MDAQPIQSNATKHAVENASGPAVQSTMQSPPPRRPQVDVAQVDVAQCRETIRVNATRVNAKDEWIVHDIPAEVEGRSCCFHEGMVAAMVFLRKKKDEAEQESTEENKKNRSINQEKTSPQVTLKRASPQPVVKKPVPKAYFNKTGVFKKNIIRGRC